MEPADVQPVIVREHRKLGITHEDLVKIFEEIGVLKQEIRLLKKDPINELGTATSIPVVLNLESSLVDLRSTTMLYPEAVKIKCSKRKARLIHDFRSIIYLEHALSRPTRFELQTVSGCKAQTRD